MQTRPAFLGSPDGAALFARNLYEEKPGFGRVG